MMLSAATLNRVSRSYARGYNDGYEDRAFGNDPVAKTDMGIPMKPFSDFDYREGFAAGVNDRSWDSLPSHMWRKVRELIAADRR